MCAFLMLPDLILLEIMSYLTPLENLAAFFDCDDQLGCNNLLRERRYSIDIHLTFLNVTSKIFRHFCRNVFPYLSSQIESLAINTNFVGDSIIYCLPNLVFRNLKSLHLHSVNVCSRMNLSLFGNLFILGTISHLCSRSSYSGQIFNIRKYRQSKHSSDFRTLLTSFRIINM